MRWAFLLALGGACVASEGAFSQPVCLPIDQIDLQGVEVVSSAELRREVAAYRGRCLGLAEFDEILEIITTYYIDQGFILSRAYLPEQDLTSRHLQIAVVEGEISEVLINGARNDGLEQAAFPGQRGKPAQIRQIEQGLDQLQAMPRWQAQMEFMPGTRAGQSVLAVSAQSQKPFQFRLSSNNRGMEATGEWITTLAADWTNFLGHADVWSVSFSKNLSPGPFSFTYDGDSNIAAGLKVQIPHGRWTYDLEANYSRNWQTIPGAVAPISTNGRNWDIGLGVKALLHRDQDTKTHVSARLTHRDVKNFIEGVLIEGSSRKLTILRFSVDHQRTLFGGNLNASAYVERGLTLFGAEVATSMPAGSPNAQFTRIGFSADWQRSFENAFAQTDFSLTASGQYSVDRLYGGQQFSLGGASTIRGSKIALASGSSGALLRSEVFVKPAMLQDTPFAGSGVYAALDVGAIAAQPAIDAKAATAIGATLGLKGKAGPADFDISYQRMLHVSDHLQAPGSLVSVSFGITF